MKDKKNIIIIGLVIIIILAVVYLVYYSNKKYDVTFKINGEENITIEYGSKYNEEGFIAQDGYGNDISDYVIISGQVNNMQAGNYQITYELNYEEIQKKLIRNIIVNKIDINKLNIVLNGEEQIYILKDSKYEEQGAYVVSGYNNENFELGKMEIDDNIDTSKVGKYTVNYTYIYDEKSITKERTVEVFEIKNNISPETVTTGKVKITIDVESMKNYSNTKLPDGKTSLNKKIEYEVNKNGEYSFIVEAKDGEKYEKKININNIIASYNCSGTITNSGTKITVSPTSGDVKNYEWIIGGKTTTGTSVYNEYKIIKNAKVNVVFNNGEKYPVDCLVEDKLLYHFTYDLKNTGTWTKPEIQCNSYTASQRTKLEKTLNQLVKEAGGKGSRGGTVEAVRFLIGGLDYRIRYQAPRNGDAVLGKYQKAGLNIGNNKAWGCRVAGYINGFDCTHFIEWALAQTGFIKGAYSYPTTETSKVIDKIKPGDVLYVKSSKSGSLTHVAIVAGIDKSKGIYYIAESVPGNDWKLGVTLHATKRSTVLKVYNTVGNVPYTKEGTVTDMWLQE